MAHGYHAELTGSNIHVPHRFTYANATAREAEAGAVAGDVGCLALQQDDNSLWRLVDDSPLTWALVGGGQVATINIVIDGGSAAITTGVKCDVEIPFNCTISQVTILADQAATAVVDLWVEHYADFPPTDADSITSATPPTITAAVRSQDTTLTDWIVALDAGQILRANVDSNDVAKRITISLKVTRS